MTLDAVIKEEGEAVRYDREQTARESVDSSYWMEIPIKSSWTRERIHREVDDWLNENDKPS